EVVDGVLLDQPRHEDDTLVLPAGPRSRTGGDGVISPRSRSRRRYASPFRTCRALALMPEVVVRVPAAARSSYPAEVHVGRRCRKTAATGPAPQLPFGSHPRPSPFQPQKRRSIEVAA